MAYHQCQPNSYQPCDTFFVESYGQQLQAPQVYTKEQLKALNRERQIALADEMSKVVQDEYADDILMHMHAMDAATLPDVDSIDIQTEIQWFMRPYLLDFLIEAHSAFQLLPTTLFLTVNILDRYCSKRVVYKRHYQLVGCAALLIAAKYGDKKDRVPTIKELKSMCCSLYDEDMFIQMEWHVLQTLGWSIGHPTVDAFLQLATAPDPHDRELKHLTLYLLEITLFHRDFVSKLSSELTRVALNLARIILNRPNPRPGDWTSTYDSSIMLSLTHHMVHPSQILARKYSSSHYSRAAKILEQFLARQAVIGKTCYPPTPPVDQIVESKPYENEVGLSTPQKQHYAHATPHGYLTPPVTPENDVFAASSNTSRGDTTMSRVCMSSPTPVSVPFGQSQQCQLREANHYGQQQSHFHQPPTAVYNTVL
ncbi:hypothetical protein VTO42DRAFT_7653 [Malbranchea cinnamomea]